MKYVIKNLKTNEYLRQGDTFFVWIPDIYYAKVFKGLKCAQNSLKNIVNSNLRFGGSGEYKIFGIEMKEIEL